MRKVGRIRWALVAMAGMVLLVGGVVATPTAYAGVKKLAKKARKKTSKKASQVVKQTKQAAVKVAQKVSATAEQLWKSFHMKLKSAEATPAYARGIFARFNPSAGLDWTNAYLLALASKIVYSNRNEAKRKMAELGVPELTWVNERNLEAFVASDARMVVVALRGTQFHSFKDFFTDLDMDSVEEYGGKVHKGTHRAVSHIWGR